MSRSLTVLAAAHGADNAPDRITAEGVLMRLTVRISNADQWRVGRELLMRLEERFVAEGFRTPLPLLSGAGAR